MSLIEEYLQNYLQNLHPKLDGELALIQQDALKNNVPIIPNEVINLIAVLLSIIKPKRILEIGTAVGFSAALMSKYLQKGGKITTIERYLPMLQKAKENIKNLNLDSTIEILEGDANNILKDLNPKDEEKFDVIFMDAAKGQYINILPDVYRLLKVGGVIIADDILQDGSVAKSKKEIVKRQRTIHYRLNDFLHEITNNPALRTSILTVGDGVAICYKIKEIGDLFNE